jgi:ketosteroid isomerase-like protein
MRAQHLFLALALILPATAEASYVRIWRGHQKAGLGDAQFLRGMNHALLPATGELALGPAKLESYLPVVLPAALEARGLPSEVALLSYESEAAYRAYRATAEGIHYGDMHWDLFDKATSASLVPAPYAGQVALEQAYEVVAGDPTLSTAPAAFRVVERGADESEAEFLARITARIEVVKAAAPTSYYVLTSAAYALEYVSGATISLESGAAATLTASFVAPLELGKTLALGVGVRYPVDEDAAEAGVRDTWTRHIAAWNARDLDAVMLDYHEGSVVIRNDEVYRGLDEIRSLFADLFARFAHVTAGSVDRVVQTGGVVYITWRATAKVDGAEVSSQQGTDTFAISGDKIEAQTITAAPAFWAFAP